MTNPLLLPSIISAASGFANIFLNKGAEQSAHERDRAEALEDWNRNNEYNSPKAQMGRFKEAGLNPQLIYGQGTPGNASASPVQTQKSGNPATRFNLQEIYGDMQRLAMNMQQTQQTVENLKTNQELTQQNIALAKQLEEQRDILLPYKRDLTDSQIYSNTTRAANSLYLLDDQKNKLALGNKYIADRNVREEALNKSALNVNSARVEQIHAATALQVQQRLKTVEDTLMRQTQNYYSHEQMRAMLNKLSAETYNIEQQRKTSMSVEQLNKANMILKNYQEGKMQSDMFWSTMHRILGLRFFTK